MTNYSYLDKTSDEIIERLHLKNQEAVLLAAFPGAGKTSAAIQVCSKYLKLYPNAKIKILTHNQNLLKKQFIRDIQNAYSLVEFTYGEFGSGCSVEIGIPASRSKITSEIDLLIIDEAHQFFLKSMDSEIITMFSPKHILLLTGTPSIFISLNNQKKGRFNIISISGEELEALDVYSDYVMDNALCNSPIIGHKLNAVYSKAAQSGANLSKIMVACKNIKEAYHVQYLLTNIYNRSVSMSTSENDSSNEEIDKFVNNETDCLIVVNRGILGFSDNMITTLLDLKRSKTPDGRIQLFARILRKHPNNIKKHYISYYSNKKDMRNEGIILMACMYLMQKHAYEKFDGIVDNKFKLNVAQFYETSDKVTANKQTKHDNINTDISWFSRFVNEVRNKFSNKSRCS